MTTTEIIKKLTQVQLSIYVHPDRQPNSEFAYCVDTLGDIIETLKASPIQAVLAALEEDEPKPVRNGFKERLEKALKEQKQLQCLHLSGDSVTDKDGFEVCPDCGKYGEDC
jgi:hypothetical protein